MKFWFDTEFFENGELIQLISIGIIAEDGREFYTETKQSRWLCGKSKWLMENVAPHLTITYAERLHKEDIAKKIVDFVGEKPEFWAYYASCDWVILCQLFGRMIDLPKGWPMFVRDVKQLAMEKGNPKLPEQSNAEHHALADARWTKEAWEFLQK